VQKTGRKASFFAFHRLLLPETDPLPWFLCHTFFWADSQRLELLYIPLQSTSFWARKARRLLDEQRYVIRYLAQYNSLSEREKEVITLVTRGKNNPAIAKELGIARPTVETHRKNIYRKLGVHSVPELVRFALAFELG
jgi:DNA-binding CsgD family transcriptional regulator